MPREQRAEVAERHRPNAPPGMSFQRIAAKLREEAYRLQSPRRGHGGAVQRVEQRHVEEPVKTTRRRVELG
jgi:hypothetical protein